MYGTTWRMPAEWETHSGTWMAWPHSGYTLGESVEEQETARRTWANVAAAIVDFEPVWMVVDPSAVEIAKTYLDSRVALIEAPLDDAWMRDIGPTFVKGTSENMRGKLGGVNWVFNGWGAQPWAAWEKDSRIGDFINSQVQSVKLDSPLINEGGGLHVNGVGVVLLTKTVQLGEGRNSKWSQAEVEAEIHRKLGTEQAIWLERGLTRDYDEFGTRGHVDIIACFSDEDTILYHDQQNPEHPDFLVSREVRNTLESAGNFKLIAVPAPLQLRDEHGWVDFSYINHYLVNGGLVMCGFDDPNDAVAREILQRAHPDRKIVAVDARPLFDRGGGIHCITQQQPR